MLNLEIKDRAWRYWLVSCICLWLAVTRYPDAYLWALAITVIQFIHYRITEGSIRKFPVQVRIAYLVVLLFALPEALRWSLWLVTLGTTLRVLNGYCFLARTVSLLPINRQDKLTWRLVSKVYFTPTVQGSILQHLPELKVNA